MSEFEFLWIAPDFPPTYGMTYARHNATQKDDDLK